MGPTARPYPDRLPAGDLFRPWAPVIFWIACILVASGDSFNSGHTASWLSVLLGLLSVVPADGFETVHLIVRKTAHLVEYGILGFLAYRAGQCTWPNSAAGRRWLATMLLVLACATVDEARQSILVSRTGSVLDVLLDMIGGSVGIYLFRLVAGRTASGGVAEETETGGGEERHPSRDRAI